MPYMDIVWRSFRISWNHKYLWLIALFSGEGGGGASFNSGYSTPQTSSRPDFSAVQEQVTTWISEHIGLIIVLLIIWLVLIVAFFILAAVCQGATVRASAEHDAERPFGLGMAWRAGVRTMWAIIRFRLLLVALLLPLWLLFVAFFVAIVIAIVNQNGSAVPGLALSGLFLIVVAFPYGLYVFFLDRLGSRALVLEQLGARASIARAHRLLFKRFGRTLVVWLLSIAVGIVLGILFACAIGIIFVPFAIVAGIMFASNSSALWPLAVGAVILLLPVSLVVGGFLAAQGSTYWTLAFRRLDLDYETPPVAPMPA
jgi:hypothetical protein